MSDFEKLSLVISIVALIISVVSIVRARKTQSAFLEFEKIHVELSKKQLQDLDEIESNKNVYYIHDTSLENGPILVEGVTTKNLIGFDL